MIKINKLPCPPELTKELSEQLLKEYKQTNKSVWKKGFIETALLKSSNNKCCYCECYIHEESKYMEIDHYYYKDKYVDKVIEWDNLLPSCKRCNGRKRDYDTLQEPFVNPSTMTPKDHLYMKNFRFYYKSEHGKMTISQLLLNEQRLVVPRFEISLELSDQLEHLTDLIDEITTGSKKSSRYTNRILSTIENLLDEAMPDAEYSATIATLLIQDQNFIEIIDWLKVNDLWDQKLQSKLDKMLESELTN